MIGPAMSGRPGRLLSEIEVIITFLEKNAMALSCPWARSEEPDHTGWMPGLLWVSARAHPRFVVPIIRLGKSLKPTIIASFSYNSFKGLANWSLEDMFFGNTFKSLRVAPPPFYNTHKNIRLMSAVSYILSAPSRFWGRKHYFCRFYSIRLMILIKETD